MIFSASEIEQFIEDGYVLLRDGFSRERAAEGRAFVCEQLGLSPDAPKSDGPPLRHLQQNFSGPPFDQLMNARLRAAFDQLMGAGRGVLHGQFGWWPVLFPGFEGPGGWHVDGHFHHRLTSREQGLVTLYLFSDIGPGDGGTPVVRGSHQAVARLIAAAEPDGLSAAALAARLGAVDPAAIVEMTGRAGDVAMLHPFVVHGFGPNRGARVRFACNPQYPLHAPMQLDRADGDHSPVEEAIRRALPHR